MATATRSGQSAPTRQTRPPRPPRPSFSAVCPDCSGELVALDSVLICANCTPIPFALTSQTTDRKESRHHGKATA
jgi:hypothetical protein